MNKNYDESYLYEAMDVLGESFDFAYNFCNVPLKEFINLFINSGYLKRFENGDFSIILGNSGIELALKVFEKENFNYKINNKRYDFSYSKEFWAGWILAFYQYHKGYSFEYIFSLIDIEEILRVYPTLHEASELKAFDVIDKIVTSSIKYSRLKEMRIKNGLTQKELAIKSNMSIRTLQEYENKSKNINKASSLTIYNLSKVLSCNIEDLLEI